MTYPFLYIVVFSKGSHQARPKKPRFPYSFEKNGSVGRIYKLGNGTFKTYFRYANSPRQNTHATFDAALLFLEREFSLLDASQANSLPTCILPCLRRTNGAPSLVVRHPWRNAADRRRFRARRSLSIPCVRSTTGCWYDRDAPALENHVADTMRAVDPSFTLITDADSAPVAHAIRKRAGNLIEMLSENKCLPWQIDDVAIDGVNMGSNWDITSIRIPSSGTALEFTARDGEFIPPAGIACLQLQ